MEQITSLNTLSHKIEDYDTETQEIMNSIKFQIESVSYKLKDIYTVVDNFDVDYNNRKDNGLYVKLSSLYEIVGNDDYYVYLKIILLNSGFSLENILFEEIICHLPDNILDNKDPVINNSLNSILEGIFYESGVSKEYFISIFEKSYLFKYKDVERSRYI